MKRIIIFLIIFLSQAFISHNEILSQSNWKWINPIPQGNNLNWVQIITPEIWIAAGDNGTFIKTTNAGSTWVTKFNAGSINPPAGSNNEIFKGWFFNSTTGMVCGENGWAARTIDGGDIWGYISTLGSSSGGNYNGLQFINNYTGYMSSSKGMILKSTDAGLSWTTLMSNENYFFQNIFVLDSNCIYALLSDGIIVSTTNGGINWTADTIDTRTVYNDVFFVDKNHGTACGYGGWVAATTNGGDNWISKKITAFGLFDLYGVTSNPEIKYEQNFDTAAFPPSGWKTVNVNGSYVWVRSVAQFHSPPASAMINYNCDTSGGLDWLISPQFHINAGDSLTFWLRTVAADYIPDSLCVRVSVTDTALSSFTNRILYLAEGEGYPDSLKWQRYSVSLSSFAGQDIYIGFKHQDFCGVGIYLDDIKIGGDPLEYNGIYYAAGDTGYIYVSYDNGFNWVPLKILEPNQFKGSWFSMDKMDSTFVVCGNSGIFNSSTNNGKSWIARNYRFARNTLNDVWCEYGTGKMWAVGAPYSTNLTFDQILYSSDGGYTFQNQRSGKAGAVFKSISMIDGNTGYICGINGDLIKTTNGGVNWDSISIPAPSNTAFNKVDFINANTGWVFSGTANIISNIWKTINGGDNWIFQSLGDTSNNGNMVRCADMVSANTGYCINNNNQPYKTTNGGLSWIKQSLQGAPIPGVMQDICMVDSLSGYICGGNTNKLFKTTNGGSNWDTVSIPYRNIANTTSWADINNGIFVGSGGTVCKTTNGGSEWILEYTGADFVNASYLKTIDTIYIVCSGGRILKLGMGPVNITWKPKIPQQFYLSQNYPNPFNPSTTIKFGLKTKGTVSLKIYDITGRLVKSYFDKTELNAGSVSIKFDGTDYASGVYFYTLIVDDKRIDTKKMVLVK